MSDIRKSVANKQQCEAWQIEYLNYRDGFIHGILAVRNMLAKAARNSTFDELSTLQCSIVGYLDDVLDNEVEVDKLLEEQW